MIARTIALKLLLLPRYSILVRVFASNVSNRIAIAKEEWSLRQTYVQTRISFNWPHIYNRLAERLPYTP
jgi:hypothetical protein